MVVTCAQLKLFSWYCVDISWDNVSVFVVGLPGVLDGDQVP